MEVTGETGPIRLALNLTGKSLRTVADEIGVNYQALYLADCGCYNSLPPSIMNWLRKVTGLTYFDLTLLYKDYKVLKRQMFPLDDFTPDQILPVGNPIKNFRAALDLSRSGFSKRYCVPAAMMYNIEASQNPPDTLSPIFTGALRDAMATHELIDHLRTRYEWWRKRARS